MLSALPVVAPAYHLYGNTEADPIHRETRRLVSVLEQFPNHQESAAIRATLEQRGVIVPVRRGQLALALSDSSTHHYDALIHAQQNDIVAWTPAGFTIPGRRSQRAVRHHVMSANDAREKLGAFEGIPDAFLCPNEFRGWRQRRLLTALNALYVDVDFHDDGQPVALDLMKEVAEARIGHLQHIGFALPSLIVYSGRGFHLYWSHGRLDESELARWTEMQKWLRATLDGDKRATDCTRFLRLIGTVHSKTGTTATADRIGPAYHFDSLYQSYLQATGRDSAEIAETAIEDEIAALRELAEPDLAATDVPLATVFDINAYNARRGRRTTHQSGIYRWFDRVYRDLRLIIEHRGWKGKVPEGSRNTLLLHLAIALSWFTEPDALRDEIMRENADLIGLPPAEAVSSTSSVVNRARQTQKAKRQLYAGMNPDQIVKLAHEAHRKQDKRARLGEFRYGSSRKHLWEQLSDLIPDDLVPQLRAIIPDDVWIERQRERQSRRDRVAEGRYQFRGDALRELQQERRQLAQVLRASGFGWDQVGATLGISAGAARMLSTRAG